jgi:hypothetical protein
MEGDRRRGKVTGISESDWQTSLLWALPKAVSPKGKTRHLGQEVTVFEAIQSWVISIPKPGASLGTR